MVEDMSTYNGYFRLILETINLYAPLINGAFYGLIAGGTYLALREGLSRLIASRTPKGRRTIETR